MSNTFTREEVSTEQIQAICDKLGPVLEEFPDSERPAIITALLLISTLLMCPVVTEEDLDQAVMGLSQWLCLFLSGKYTGETELTNPTQSVN